MDDPQALRQRDRQPDGGDQHGLAAPSAAGAEQRGDQAARDGKAEAGGGQASEKGCECQPEGQSECGGRGGHHAQRRIGTGHRDLAESQVDPAEQAIDEGIGRGQQPIERCRHQAVGHLLHAIGDDIGTRAMV